MPESVSQTAKHDFLSLSPRAFDELVKSELGWKPFRGKQVRQWVYDKGVTDPNNMTNLSKADRAVLSERFTFGSAEVTRQQVSEDGTIKLLLTWANSAVAETVMIPDGPRRTACVSSQVGCPVGCRFCASGMDGVKGNLSAGQIVEQVVALNRQMRQLAEQEAQTAAAPEAAEPPRINHVVFMGMGEPMANYAHVMDAIRILHDPECFNIGGRKITVSTVGVPAKIRQMAQEQLPLNLAISLHAPTEPLRKQLIPWAEHFALPDILDAARFYFEKTGREITLEYILLRGVNDQVEHARQLVSLCRRLRANVNLIRYNEVEGLPFGRPESPDVVRFQEVLRRGGVNAHVRKSRGRDIDAACGQLRRRQQQSEVVQIGRR